MINSFMQQKFNDKIKSTDSVKSLSVMIQLHTMDKEVNLELWDLPGRGDFIVLNRMYLRDTNAALIVYDVNDAKSLKSAEVWISEL